MPVLLALPADRLAGRILRLDPDPRRSAAIATIHPLGDDAFKSHAADVIKYGRAVAAQVLAVLDSWPLASAEQSGEPLFALDQRQVEQRCRTWIGLLSRSAWRYACNLSIGRRLP